MAEIIAAIDEGTANTFPGISITDERLIEIGTYTKHCTEAVVSSSR